MTPEKNSKGTKNLDEELALLAERNSLLRKLDEIDKKLDTYKTSEIISKKLM